MRHGIEPRGAFEIRTPGLNYRLSDIVCAVGIPQVRRLDELLEARRRVAEGYEQRLRGVVAATRASSPGRRAAYEQALALPLHSRLGDGELDRVAEIVARYA